MSKQKKPDTEILLETKTSRELRVKLTETELLAQGQKMAEAMEALDEAVANKKATVTHYKALEEEAQGRANAARTLLRNGYDYRKVDCTLIKNWQNKTVSVRRDDTGEIVEHRAMHNSELQIEIPAEAETEAVE